MAKKRLLKPLGEAKLGESKQKRKTEPPDEVERKMGQTVMDFANAETTDAACFKHFENMQEFIEGVSDKFTNKVKEIFPSLNSSVGSLSEPEKEALTLIWEENGIREELKEKFSYMQCDFYEYDCEKETLTLDEIRIFGAGYNESGEPEADVQFGGTSTISVNTLADELPDFYGYDKTLAQLIVTQVERLMTTCKKILELKTLVPEDRLEELRSSMESYLKIVKLHDDIAELQEGLRNILGGIVENTYLYYLPGFGEYIARYNNFPQRVVVYEDHVFPSHPFSERFYLNIKNEDGWVSRFQSDLAYCLIGFLMVEGNRKYITKCLNCEKYFIATKYNPANPSKFCRYNGDKCRFDWHNKRKIESGEAAKYMKEGRAEGKYQ